MTISNPTMSTRPHARTATHTIYNIITLELSPFPPLSLSSPTHTPESIFGYIIPGAYESHELHVSSHAVSPSGMLSLLSRNCTASPSDTCHAMWQCMIHAPGLSVGNAMASHPPPGSSATSRRVGLSQVRLAGEEDGSKAPEPRPRT